MSDKPITTPIKYAIHGAGVNPIFGDGVIHVEVDDIGGGPFIVLTAADDRSDGGIAINLDELELAAKLGRQMVKAAEGTEK